MRRFARSGKGLRWHLLDEERQLLEQLVTQVDEALDGPLDDAVVTRLFPRAVDDDPEADAELRALLAGDLLLRRHEACAAVLDLLAGATRRRGEVWAVQLDPEAQELLLGVLNDLRLALGARVGEDVVAARGQVDDPAVDDPAVDAVLDTMDWLAGLQVVLLDHMA